jgi:hypothetical protein
VDEHEWITSREQVLGYEFDWYAIDGDGCLALCSAFGWGTVPSVVFKTPRKNCQYYEAPLIEKLPETGVPQTAEFGSCDAWDLLCRRGLYIYDNADSNPSHAGPYQRIGVPSVPLIAQNTAVNLIEILQPVLIKKLRFANDASFNITR